MNIVYVVRKKNWKNDQKNCLAWDIKKKKIFYNYKNQNYSCIYLHKFLVQSKLSHNLNFLFKYASLLKKKLYKLWIIKTSKTDQIGSILNLQRLKPETLEKFLKPNLNSKFLFSRYKKMEDSSLFPSGLWLKKYNKKKKLKNWINIRMLEKKISLFYGFKNVKNFKILQDAAFYVNKLRSHAIFKLEGMFSTIIFRLNFAPSCYMSRNLINSGLFQIDNSIIYNHNYQIKLFQDISVSWESFYYHVLTLLNWNLEHHRIYLNVPNYIEISYDVLHACFWRYPLKNEIVGPYTFPFSKSPYEWSMSSYPVRR